jgi:membrane-associated phospholipid phosphatase
MQLKNKKHLTARIISTLFVPPSFSLIIFTLFAFRNEANPDKIIITLLTALIFAFTLPIALFFILRHKGKIINSDATIKEERTLPFSVSIIFYLIGLAILIFSQINIVSIAFWFCYISNTVLIIIINKYWKISAHMMGAAGPFAALCFVYGLSALPFILILFMIGWSRIYLKCHNIYQVLAGSLLGFMSTLLQMQIITGIFNAR